jgi:enamine deaminase RidA (YjgF/YER057c/UK114 family)
MAVSITRSNPTTVRQPTGYSHAIEIIAPDRWLVISGQVGVAPDGTIPETGGGQITQALANLRAVIEANDMGRFSGCSDRAFGGQHAGLDAVVRLGPRGSAFRGGD